MDDKESFRRLQRVLSNAEKIFNSWPKWKQDEARAEFGFKGNERVPDGDRTSEPKP